MNLKRFSLLVTFCFAFAFAYIVQRGDTLWDLSDKYFKDPFLWVDIWEVNKESLEYLNKHIDKDNPNPISTVWIYPGDSLCIPGEEECPKAGKTNNRQQQVRAQQPENEDNDDLSGLQAPMPKAASNKSKKYIISGGHREEPKILNAYYQRLMPILEQMDESSNADWHAVFSDEPKKPIFYSIEHEVVLDFGKRKYSNLKEGDLAEIWYFEKVAIPNVSGVGSKDYILNKLAAIVKLTAVGDSLSRAVIVQSFSSLKITNARARLPKPTPILDVKGFNPVKQAKLEDMARVLLIVDKSLLVNSYSYVIVGENRGQKYTPGMAVAFWDIDGRDKTLPPRLLGRGLVVHSDSKLSTVLLREIYSASRSIEAGVLVSITHDPIR